jgi:glycosyltransferase involved in cell wall biosynthesis
MTLPRRALICSPVLPEFDRESGSRRLFAIIEFLTEAGWSVTFAARHTAGGDRYVDLLQQRGVETYARFDASLERAVATAQFDLAILAFWYVAEQWLAKIRRVSPRTHILIESIDLNFLRDARRIMCESGDGLPPASLDSTFANRMLRELNVYAAADGVLTVSDKEAALVDDLAGGPRLAHVVPDAEDLEASTVPPHDRKGMLFVGNFKHPPNIQAAEYLLHEIVPRIDSDVLNAHPLFIVGNALEQHWQRLEPVPANVHLVGWVPSVLPYIQRARLTVVPLLHGAGTKRKVIQALMVGTPTVASGIGAEGLDLRDGEHALIADDPDTFARCVARLAKDDALWQRLATDGRTHVLSLHGRDAVRARFEAAIADVLARPTKRLRLADLAASLEEPVDDAYRQLLQRIARLVRTELRPGARVAVVSKGDTALVNLDGITASHFPSTDGGLYAGYYPGDSAAAIAHLEAQRKAGAEYLLFPQTAFWWLDYYTEFHEHLERHYPLVVSQNDTCLIFQLDPSAIRPTPEAESPIRRVVM